MRRHLAVLSACTMLAIGVTACSSSTDQARTTAEGKLLVATTDLQPRHSDTDLVGYGTAVCADLDKVKSADHPMITHGDLSIQAIALVNDSTAKFTSDDATALVVAAVHTICPSYVTATQP